MNMRNAVQHFAAKLERAVMDSQCSIKDKTNTTVYEGACFVSRRRQASTPKTDPASRSVARLVNIKLPLSAPKIELDYKIRIEAGTPEELIGNIYIVKDNGESSQFQFCKNLIAETTGKVTT